MVRLADEIGTDYKKALNELKKARKERSERKSKNIPDNVQE